MPNSLAIIGAGRVGRALGRRLRELGWKIGAVVTRSGPSARRAVRFIGDGKACEGMTRRILASRVILIATPDDEIAVVAQELARIGEEELRGRVVLRTSGAMDSAVLDAVPETGNHPSSKPKISASISPSQKPGSANVNVVPSRIALSSQLFGRSAATIANGTPIRIDSSMP